MHMLNGMFQVKGHLTWLPSHVAAMPWYMVLVWTIDHLHLHMVRLESMQGMLRELQTMPYLQLIQVLHTASSCTCNRTLLAMPVLHVLI